MTREQRQVDLIVDEDDDDLPVRLDQYLTVQLADQSEAFSRSRVQKLINEGRASVNGRVGKAGEKLKGGETVSLLIPPDVELNILAEDIALDILYEDDHLVVVNKPCGMVTHPGAGVFTGTLVNALMHHCKDNLSGISGVLRPGIVHRLDKDTSGVLVVAKNDGAHQSLAAQIKEKTAARQYLAIIEGHPPSPRGLVDKPIGRHGTDRKKMSINPRGRAAQTEYQVLSESGAFCLIEAKLRTGRTHQIRVHMASLNCPVVGDTMYNRKSTGTLSARHKLGLKGQALHAALLSFIHPSTGVLLKFEAPIPEDFRAAAAQLGIQITSGGTHV